jgi:hypothetical protein
MRPLVHECLLQSRIGEVSPLQQNAQDCHTCGSTDPRRIADSPEDLRRRMGFPQPMKHWKCGDAVHPAWWPKVANAVIEAK